MNRLWLKVLALYRPYWAWVLLSLALALVTLAANVALMAMSGWFITAMAVAGIQGATMNYFTPAAIIRACAILRTGGRYAERLVSHETTFRLLASLRVWLYGRLEPLPPTALSIFHSGDLSNRLRADVDRLDGLYPRLFTPLVVAVAATAGMALFLAAISPALAIIQIVGMSMAAAAIPALAAYSSRRAARQRVALATALAETTVDGLQGMGELLAFDGAAAQFRTRFLGLGRHLVAVQCRIGHLAGLSLAGHVLASNLTLWAALVVAIPLVRAGLLDGPHLVMITLAVLACFEAAAPLAAGFLGLGAMAETIRRLFTLPPAPATPTASLVQRPQQCDLVLSGVSFRYGDNLPLVLDNVNFQLPQGGRLALLGPVGSGKSTLVALITGLLPATQGRITLNGQILTDYDGETLRRCFAVASQDAPLFTGTIRSNLALANPEAPDTALWHALAIAQLETFVRDLPDGLDTAVGEAGLTLSGGQARRLAVARALLRDSPILVLDEPGEGLDLPTERALLRAVVAGLGRRSLLLITHRAAGLDLMDQQIHL